VQRIPLSGRGAFLASVYCLIPVLLGFGVPFAFLSYEAIQRGLVTGFDPDLVRHTFTTVSLAATATAIAIVLGLMAAIAARMARDKLAGTCLTLAGLGYAIPGTVLALGLLTPLVGIDNFLNAVSQVFGGPHLGLIIAGSSAALVIAYVIRFLAIAAGSAQAGLVRVAPAMDDVARTLGARPAGVAFRILMPLTRPALGGAALLVFVDCLKELPATLLLRPLNVETLSTYIYQYATRGSFEEGALAALLIVAVGILPVIHLTRFSEIAPAVATPGSDGRKDG
jgi:iron(III) transport system permease protein